jgi:2-keto-4-pentenoate hydratase
MMDWASRLLACHKSGAPYPNPSAENTVSIEDAYRIQKSYNALRREAVAGFKAALTAPAAQAAMGIDQAIAGVLYQTGDFSAAPTISISQPLLLETELGFHCTRAIDSPTSPADVLDAFGSMSPCIELASPNLEAKPTGVDLIATNSASFGFIVGPQAPIDTGHMETLTASLSMSGEELFSGSASEVMGGQANALSWLVNQVLATGYPIAPGALFMTGSIGGMAPAKPGTYSATFSNLPDINFHLVSV